MNRNVYIPPEVLDRLGEAARDLATEEVAFPSGPVTTNLWMLLAKVYIPNICHNTVKHIAWRYNMLSYHEHIVHGLPAPESILTGKFLMELNGASAKGVPYKSHADFVRACLNPDLPHLSAGQASRLEVLR